MYSSIFAAAFGNEAISDAALEIERCWFGKIAVPEDLKKAESVEKIEQWEIRSPNGVIRVRAYNDEEYELCVKKDTSTDDSGKVRIEKEMDIDKEFFLLIKSMSTCGTVKHRYEFPIENTDLKWEIDVYNDADDKPVLWCKIDLEVPTKDYVVPDFPITIEEHFDADDCDDDHKQFQRDLFNRKYNRINANNIQVPFPEENE